MGVLAECPQCHKKQAPKNRSCKCGADLVALKKAKKVRYWITYRLPGGKQRREAVSGEDVNPYSIESAREMLSKRVVQKKEKRIFDVKPDTKMTFQELADWYMSLEKVKALSSFWRVELCLKKFNSVFGDRIVGHIKPADLENYQAMRLKEGRAPATVDQELGDAKAMVYKAFDNDLVGGDTLKAFKVVKKLLKANANARDRILSPSEYQSLFEAAAPHLKPILANAYWTGMRRGEILSLTWDKVDFKGRLITLEASDTKDREPRKVPICDELIDILRELPTRFKGRHVFTFNGNEIKGDIRDGLKEACKKAGISYGRGVRNGFVFHDFRHTFNTNMRKAGVPESVIMAVTGHSTREMFDRYNTVDLGDTRAAVDQMGRFLKSVDQTVDQVAENENPDASNNA